MPNMKTICQKILKILGGQTFLVKAPVTLTFDLKINIGYKDCWSKGAKKLCGPAFFSDLVNSKSIGVIYKSCPTSMPNMKTTDQNVVTQLSRQAF
jgi:hypothetical protein